MEYQKIANLLSDGSNKPSKFRTRNWVEINDEARGTYFLIKKLNLKHQCKDLVYVIIVMHIYLQGVIQKKYGRIDSWKSQKRLKRRSGASCKLPSPLNGVQGDALVNVWVQIP